MGCIVSRNGADTLRDIVNRPGGEVEHAFTRDEINTLLGIVAQKLAARGRDITIVAVGGAVNTVLLRSRQTTQDNKDITDVIRVATDVAIARGIGQHWLNNHTVIFVQEAQIVALYAEALQQNVPLFHAPGLRVLAAPWRYALIAKLDRLMKPGPKPYDLTDAVAYLGQIVSRARQPVQRATLHAWAAEFRCTPPNEALVLRVSAEYLARYQHVGIA
ncbi:hypothetical protein BD413DRAFT_605616 [Trametes elegans]|nr:hypothetical protein BD413DRAFT_605616 [Trametes elegans]